jgi:cytochrome c oxidase subunit III
MRVQIASIPWPKTEAQSDTALPRNCGHEDSQSEQWDTASSIPAPSLALWVVIVTVTMLFAGFISAYLIRRTSGDWAPIYSPALLIINTILIVSSSLALQFTQSRQQNSRIFAVWMYAGIGLGIAFIAGQIQVWRELAAAGIFLSSSPHGSFFFMLSAAHAVHVLAGVAALLYALRRSLGAGIERAARLSAAAIVYWHFVTGVWIALYVLLFVWD